MNQRQAIRSRLHQSLCGSRMFQNKKSSASTTYVWPWRKVKSFELSELESNFRTKLLLFSARIWSAANLCLDVPMFFFFSTQYRPLYTDHKWNIRLDWFPVKLRLTQAPNTIATVTTIYKASTFRLRSYKAYIRMINMPILGGKYH